MKYKIIALCGKSASGKNSLLKNLVDRYVIHEIIPCTTRPKREKEQEGIDYFYLTVEDFLERVENGEMLEYANFNSWYYGTLKSSLSAEKWNVGIFNPAGIEQLKKNHDIELKVYYLDATDKMRLMRQLVREDNPDVHEIIRRFGTDEEDFSYLPFDYEILQHENIYDLQEAVAKIGCKSQLFVKKI